MTCFESLSPQRMGLTLHSKTHGIHFTTRGYAAKWAIRQTDRDSFEVNDDAKTTFADVKKVFTLLEERIEKQLAAQARH